MFHLTFPAFTLAFLAMCNSLLVSDTFEMIHRASILHKTELLQFSFPTELTPNKFQLELLQASVYSRSRLMISKRLKPHTRSTKGVLLYLTILLICHSADIEAYPGPPKYPCGECDKACTWNPKKPVIACDSCDIWYHKDCVGLSSTLFSNLARSDASWICCNCGTPNFSNCLTSTVKIALTHSSTQL